MLLLLLLLFVMITMMMLLLLLMLFLHSTMPVKLIKIIIAQVISRALGRRARVMGVEGWVGGGGGAVCLSLSALNHSTVVVFAQTTSSEIKTPTVRLHRAVYIRRTVDPNKIVCHKSS